MSERGLLLGWSFSAGRWFHTQVRISVLFPLIVLLLCVRNSDDLTLALAFGGVLLLSVLFHEFGHIAAARLTGGHGYRVLLWPLGGLAEVTPGPTRRSKLWTLGGGLVVNAAFCLATLWPVWVSEQRMSALDPFTLPAVALGETLAADLLILVFAANWLLLLVNLLPVPPFDGGRLLRSLLDAETPSGANFGLCLRVGLVAALAIMLVGLFIDQSWAVAVGALVLALNVRETYQAQPAEEPDETFLGYDFSAGYTSLEQTEAAAETQTEAEPRRGFFARWSEKRRRERERQEVERAEEAEQILDALLEKVHLTGIDSLTATERRLLARASERYRSGQS